MKRFLAFVYWVTVSWLSIAQDGMVTGRVTDTSGEPVIGAAIYYEGLNTVNATTDFNGNYSIKSIPGKSLVFSCIGMKEKSVSVTSPTKMDIILEQDNFFLEDAVVIGYGEQQRQDLTGSISSVKADELRKSSDPDVLGALRGKVAGLNISSHSGEPGAGYSISIRGNNSINASSTPLIVIDGMQMDINSAEYATSSMSLSGADPLSFLNPVDIQSVEVLKDASATAIYGARGANGVILITTKSGTSNAGKTAITFDANFNVTTMARDLDMLSGQEWINYRFERGDSDWWYFGTDTDGDGVEDTPKTVADYGREAVDWRDVMFRKAFSQQYNLSVRASVGKGTNILTSIGYLNQQGLIVNNGYNKLTAKVKVDHEVNARVKIGVNVNYARTKSTGAATSSGGTFSGYGMTQMIYLEKPIERFEDPADANSSYSAFTSIYDCITDESSRTGISDRLVGNAYFSCKIIDDLTLRVYASGNISSATNNEFYSAKTRWGRFNNGVATSSNSNSYGVTANATLTYKHAWKKKHNFDVMVGGELGDYGFMSYSQEAVDFEEDALGDMSMAMGTIKNPVQVKNSSSRLSAFGRANYNFDWRYYITLNFRADASSKFSRESRVGYFPSVSAAWRISNEPWMKAAKQKAVDNLKLRMSAGLSGNDRISNYAYMSYMDKIYYSSSTGSQLLGTAELSLGNEKLKWETTYQYDLGLDLTLFKGRVDFVFDAYYKDTRDMLFMATLPSQMGFTSQWQNIGSVSNKGIELTLNTVNVRKDDFSWNTSLTFSLNRNRIESLGEGVSVKPNNISKGAFKDDPTQLMTGHPIGIIYGYIWDGNYQLSDFDIYYMSTSIPVDPSLVNSANYNDFDYVLKDGVTSINGVNPKPGDRKLKDISGDNIINSSDDKTIIGNCLPDFTYGIGNTFTWKGLSLYVFFDGVYGKDILNEFKYSTVSGGVATYNNITKDAYYNAWRPENGSNKHARLINQSACQEPLSTYFVEDGSFIKLRTLSLSYNFPRKICRPIHFESLKLSFTVDNVYTWTKYTGLDPDITSSNPTFPGMDRMAYPAGRTYSLGIIANF